MRVPISWLRAHIPADNLSDDDLAWRLTMAGLEVEQIICPNEPELACLDTKVTPNRGDLLSIAGVARELGAIADLDPVPQVVTRIPVDMSAYPVSVESAVGCPRYCAAVINGVGKLPATPAFMVERLEAAGLRSLGIIVDITNYVMLELGQPLHAYDADRIGGREIIVRYAAKGERARTLDGVERVLTPEVLVIADKDDVIGLAGVMGGETSEVTESTTSIVLESAHFDQGVIRRGAKSLGLSTEASYRFERVVDPELPPVAMARAIDLLVEYASVERPRSIVDSNTGLRPVPTLSMRMSRAKDVLGVSLPKAFVADKLRRLGFGVVSDGETVHATVPSWRADLSREIDLVEEVGRLWGYDRLPETLPAGSLRGADSPSGSFERHLRSMLTGVGLTECFSHTLGAVSAFDDSEALAHRITVRSALSSDLSGLRTSLLPGLIGAIGLNLRNKQHDIRLFEIGKVFDTPNPGEYREHRSVSAALCGEAIDYFSAKGVAEAILSDLGLLHGITWKAVARGGYHPGRCAEILVDGRCVGMVGETDPDIARQSLDLQQGLVRIACLELDADVLADLSRALPVPRYAEPPRFPSVVRDIAMVYGDNVPYQDISDCIVRSAGDLAKTVSLLSVFTGDRIGEGKKSVALRLVMRSPERTLTDADVDTVMDGVRSALETQLNAVGR